MLGTTMSKYDEKAKEEEKMHYVQAASIVFR